MEVTNRYSLLWYSGYRRCFLNNVGYLPHPVRSDMKGGLNFLGEVQEPRSSPRTKFPLRETLNDFFESLDNFVHIRSLFWIIANHVVKERFHEFEASFVTTNVSNDGVSLYEFSADEITNIVDVSFVRVVKWLQFQKLWNGLVAPK